MSVPEAIPKETVVTGAPEMDLLDGFGADGSRAGVGPGSSKPLPTPSALVSLDGRRSGSVGTNPELTPFCR